MVRRLGKLTLKSEKELPGEKEEVIFQAERTTWAKARRPESDSQSKPESV